jgi:hypothetical protein
MLLESDPYHEIFTGRLTEITMIKGGEYFMLYKFK